MVTRICSPIFLSSANRNKSIKSQEGEVDLHKVKNVPFGQMPNKY